MSAPHLTIVVPCFNEALRLGCTLDRIRTWVAGQRFVTEILIVDDGSTDGTSELATAHLDGVDHRILRHATNRGKGGALRTGMMAARGDFVLFTDADLSTPIEHADTLLRTHAEGVPVVIGSRRLPGAEVTRHQGRVRESMGKAYTWLSTLLICPGITDCTCGFKSFSREAAHDIFGRLRENGWAYDSEVLFLARRAGHAVVEVPVRWANDPNTRVNLIRDSIDSALGLARIRWRAMTGAYDATRRADS